MEPTTLTRQLEELQLIQCSLLPGELLVFVEDCTAWNELLESHGSGITTPLQPSLIHGLPLACFQVRLEAWRTWFEVTLPSDYLGYLGTKGIPLVSVRGDDLARSEQQRWQEIVKVKLTEIGDTEYPIYQLITLHLLPLLSADRDRIQEQFAADHDSPSLPIRSPSAQYHALFSSHHLISPNKRRSLQQWSSSLTITGFAKVGYPGVIYAQGAQESIEEFVANVKAMQWLALRLRFMEPLPVITGVSNGAEKGWSEFQKVGEVVEEMRKIGREEYLTEMGIGSLGTK